MPVYGWAHGTRHEQNHREYKEYRQNKEAEKGDERIENEVRGEQREDSAAVREQAQCVPERESKRV